VIDRVNLQDKAPELPATTPVVPPADQANSNQAVETPAEPAPQPAPSEPPKQ
jgi:hypothetical protein